VPTVAGPADGVASATPEELADEIVRLRAESAALQKQLDESTKADPEPTKKRRAHSGRWWGSTICLVLGAILLPMSVIGRWSSTTLLDTDTYVATVAPLADNEDTQEAVAFRASELIVEVIDVEALVRDDLPSGTRFLAGPIEAAAQTLIDNLVEDFVSSDAFARFWSDANRLGHEGVVAVLTGDTTDNIDAADGRVVLKVGPLVQTVITELDDILGLDLANSIPEEQLDGEFVIVDSDDLSSLQGTVKLFDQLSVIIPILTLALFAASIYLSRPRRIGWRNVGYAIVIPMALCLLLYTWVRGQYVDGLPDDTHNPDAAAAFFDVTTRFLTRDLWVVLVIGVIILVITWLIGPTGWAGRARAWWKELISRAGDESASSEVGELPRWVARNERGLLSTTFVLGVATLLLWTLPTGTVVLLITLIVALVMSAIHALAEIGRTAEADIQTDADAATEASEVEAAHADAAKLEGQSSIASE
jgi:hypothetical protein